MHDSIEMERRGIPAVEIVTRPFVSSALLMAKIQGVPDYPFAVVKHPLSPLSDEEIRERAREAFVQVLRCLGVGGADAARAREL